VLAGSGERADDAAVLAPLTGAGMARSVLVSHPIDAADTTCHWLARPFEEHDEISY